MDKISDDLYVAASWDTDGAGIVLDCTTFPDAELTPASEREIARLVTTAEVLRANGYAVILRCTAGRNRAPLIAALVLKDQGLTGEEAVKAVRTARQLRGGVLTNDSFVHRLNP